jgi:GNAT superfamily N-acetyltransferase
MRKLMNSARIEIRKAVLGDAEAATEVLRRSIMELCKADHRNDPERLAPCLANKRPEIFAAWLNDANNHVFVAVRDGNIAGVGSVTSGGYIGLNYVAPEARSSGVSRQMLTHLEHEARGFGLARVFLTSTATARNFYLAAGYRLRRGEAIIDTSEVPMEKLFDEGGSAEPSA